MFARKTEKDDLMKDIQSSLARPSSGAAPPRPPPPPPSSTTDSSHQQSSAPAPNYPTQQQYPSPYYPMMPNVLFLFFF